ncbi:purine-cytosine permease (2.A.39) family protein [Abortiporus biennis]
MADLEKQYYETHTSDADEKLQKIDVTISESSETQRENQVSKEISLTSRILVGLSQWGVELQGITPIPLEQRTDRRMWQMFFVWFSANANVLTLGAGTVGPAFFGLGILDSFWVILVVDFIVCAFPACFAVFGPKLGTRAMVQSRFSWGCYGAIIPSILNAISMQGYLIINSIVGGQTLASVSGHLSDSVGIVIIGLISLVVVFCGYRVLHWYETIAWIPNVIAFIVMISVGGKHLIAAPLSNPTPVPASALLTFGSTLAATVISWSPITPDYGVYHNAQASNFRIFIYAYLGFLVSSIPAHMMGAAFTAASFSIPEWQAGLGNGNDVGDLIAAILQPAGGFGKFLLVLLALTTPSACAPTMYTVCTSLMTISPVFARIPRFVIAIVSTAILIPVAIVCDKRFYATFVQILSFIGYWLAPFTAIILVEHILYRQATWSSYKVQSSWNKPNRLPKGFAAITTFIITIGIIVLCMEQEWWTGPIARSGAETPNLNRCNILTLEIFVFLSRMYDYHRDLQGSLQL